jgi:hypothetical protein
MRKWLRRIAIGFGVLVLLLVGAVLVAQRVSDGPMGPLAGGPLRSGELVTDPNVDWSVVEGKEFELQLVDPPRSRVTGAMVHDGQLYVPCDLGFFWRRVPDTRFRTILSVIWSVKRWHEDALRDGRAVVRVDGKRYEREAVRVTDPELLATLRGKMEEGARKYFEPMGGLRTDVPADPEAIWFFRLDPRS